MALTLALALAFVGLAAPEANAAPSCTWSSPAESSAAPVPERLGANVWGVRAAVGEPTPANGGVVAQLLVVLDNERLWLIGSGPTPAFGATLACVIERTTGRTVTDVIVTRAAPELSMGNPAFTSARLWALPEVMVTMRERCGQCMAHSKARLGVAGESLSDAAIRVPDSPIGRMNQRRGRLGPFDWLAVERAPGERVLVLKLTAPAASRATGPRSRHEPGPGSPLVIAQGLMWAGDVPDLRDTRSDALLASLRALQAFAGPSRLWGEQGGVGQPAEIDRHITYIESLRSAVRRHLAKGDVPGASGSEVDLPAFAALPGYALRHPLNLQRVWRELEPEVFR
ncbi:hypothetical protein BH11PSE8_BH11PSE8_21720 [soil metagenome]